MYCGVPVVVCCAVVSLWNIYTVLLTFYAIIIPILCDYYYYQTDTKKEVITQVVYVLLGIVLFIMNLEALVYYGTVFAGVSMRNKRFLLFFLCKRPYRIFLSQMLAVLYGWSVDVVLYLPEYTTITIIKVVLYPILFSGRRDLPQIFLRYIIPFSAFVNIVFLVFLWKDICQTRPQYVKAYFVYSVAITILIALISVVILCSNPHQLDAFIGLLIGCGLKDLPQIFFLFVMPVIAVLNIIFLVFLWKGICYSRPKHVKGYFVYSVTVTTLMGVFFGVMLNCDPEQLGWDGGITHMYWTFICFVVGCVLHTVFLVLVYLTYRKLIEEAKLYDQVLLVNA